MTDSLQQLHDATLQFISLREEFEFFTFTNTQTFKGKVHPEMNIYTLSGLRCDFFSPFSRTFIKIYLGFFFFALTLLYES